MGGTLAADADREIQLTGTNYFYTSNQAEIGEYDGGNNAYYTSFVFADGDSFRRSRKGMNYFYENISMIPDERSYLVRDIGTRAVIGTLDESFVASFAEEYAMFIAKGRTWRIVEMREDEILVEEAREVGSVPNWVGSDIPVPYEVAMEVGRMRRLRNLEEYPGDEGCRSVLRKYFAEQDERFVMPTDKRVTVEVGDRLAIVNGCFGSRVNETLGKIYAALLTARLGESVGMTADPYRVILELPRNMKREDILQTVLSVKPGTVEALARITVVNSSFLRWRFVFVAKKFGIIEKNADHRFMNFQRLFEMHKDTPAYREAVDKVLWEDLDIPNTERVVSMMADKEIEVVLGRISTIGLEGITRSKELMQPVRADHSILMALKKRLEDEVMFASCLNCGSQWRFRVGDAPKRFRCPQCGGVMIAVLKGYERENIRLVKLQELSAQEKKDRLRLSRNANLVNEGRVPARHHERRDPLREEQALLGLSPGFLHSGVFSFRRILHSGSFTHWGFSHSGVFSSNLTLTKAFAGTFLKSNQ